MLTIEDALVHLGHDIDADDITRRKVAACLAAAERTMLGAVGDDVREILPDDPRADELVRIYLDDLYDERGLSAKVSGAMRRQVQTLEQQLIAERRRALKGAGA